MALTATCQLSARRSIHYFTRTRTHSCEYEYGNLNTQLSTGTDTCSTYPELTSWLAVLCLYSWVCNGLRKHYCHPRSHPLDHK
eukprot:scaffold149456_cov19-Prasinocladus_malaysianus.AAC.1